MHSLYFLQSFFQSYFIFVKHKPFPAFISWVHKKFISSIFHDHIHMQFPSPLLYLQYPRNEEMATNCRLGLAFHLTGQGFPAKLCVNSSSYILIRCRHSLFSPISDKTVAAMWFGVSPASSVWSAGAPWSIYLSGSIIALHCKRKDAIS